ncbi:MAG: helix-turn-helix domain-containing protein [Hyphomicrobiales bacterium]
MSTVALQEVLGPEGLARLAKEFGGQMVYVPKRPDLVRQTDLAEFRELRTAGLSIKQIADRKRVSQRTVYRQLALFA